MKQDFVTGGVKLVKMSYAAKCLVHVNYSSL